METEFDDLFADDAKPLGEMNMNEVNELCAKYAELEAESERLAEQQKELNDRIGKLGAKILQYVETYGQAPKKGANKMVPTSVGVFSFRETKSVNQPATIEEKLKLFDYLKEQGLFENMVSVNAKTLSSWAFKEIEAKESEGKFGWLPPGLSKINTFKSLTFKASK